MAKYSYAELVPDNLKCEYSVWVSGDDDGRPWHRWSDWTMSMGIGQGDLPRAGQKAISPIPEDMQLPLDSITITSVILTSGGPSLSVEIMDARSNIWQGYGRGGASTFSDPRDWTWEWWSSVLAPPGEGPVRPPSRSSDDE
jgi:hypothetical protein